MDPFPHNFPTIFKNNLNIKKKQQNSNPEILYHLITSYNIPNTKKKSINNTSRTKGPIPITRIPHQIQAPELVVVRALCADLAALAVHAEPGLRRGRSRLWRSWGVFGNLWQVWQILNHQKPQKRMMILGVDFFWIMSHEWVMAIVITMSIQPNHLRQWFGRGSSTSKEAFNLDSLWMVCYIILKKKGQC
jgi:hypothetical protein